LCRYTSMTEPEGWVYEPSLAIAAQGAKQITIGPTKLSVPMVFAFEQFKKTLLLYTKDKEGGMGYNGFWF
ncbi:AraC family transcriptional regulator, partial [Shigella sp. FC1967]|uniref:AraC family transcriptional regulator n=1 Tax=Shigella sp. FC1967 TaxID=1898041 RepID=UPI000AE06904